MFPGLADKCCVHRSIFHPVFGCECSYGDIAMFIALSGLSVSLSAFANNVFCQFSVYATFAAWAASFSTAVVHVVLLSSKEKMRRVDARRIVPAWTVVADEQSVGDWTEVNFPR